MKYVVLLLCIVLTSEAFSQTYYYERTAVVENGVKKAASGDGHFITFTSKGCYDSDKNGYTENNGFIEYKRTENNIRNYYGDSYFGKAYYYFSTDYSRLNIKEESTGKTYVYIKKTIPSGNVVSSHKKSNYTPALIPPTPIDTDNIWDSNSNSSGSNNSSTNSNRYGYYTCPSCYGSGKCPACGGKQLTNNPYTGNTMVCYVCNNKGQCSACGGTGKKYGVVK